ncbi:MAG: D-aminoacylase [Firmicutes bacterium]|nr:D-aminoacylase [Bacillota bacterium]
MFDLILKNCRILDGTGSPWQRGDVAVKDGRIAAIGKLIPDGEDGSSLAAEVVDGEDRYLAPGFIDIHSHSDTTLMTYPQAESRILQGVTTELGGNCGISAAPVSADEVKRKLLHDYTGDLAYTWRSVDDYLSYMEEIKPSVNLALIVGHGTLRIAAMGFDKRVPTAKEMDFMKGLLAESLEDGAFGMTSGLIYPPGSYSETEELTELCKVLPRYGAFYGTHMRNEGNKLLEAVEEALTVARESGAPLEISHHKAVNKQNWKSLCYQSTARIEEARRQGIDVRCDQYPYIATATSLDSNVPIWAFEGGVEQMLARLQDPETRAKLRDQANQSHEGRWQNIFVSYCKNEADKWVVGKNIVEIATALGKDPADACFDLVLASRSRIGEVNYAMCEEDVEYIMQKPYVMIGSDGNSFSLDYDGMPHPRAYATFPRVIAHYSRDRGLFPLEEAIRKMTSMPAARMGLTDRGLIKEGFCADLVLFDYDQIQDTPTFANPKTACAGILRVYVNGVLTAKDGVHTGARAGKMLRHGRQNG